MELSKTVSKAHKHLGNVEKYRGISNAALQSAKGQQLLYKKAKESGDKRGEKRHMRILKKHQNEYYRYDDLSAKAMSEFLITKVSALYGSERVVNGKEYIDSLIGKRVSTRNIDEYETKYKQSRRYREGSIAESEHVKKLLKKI